MSRHEVMIHVRRLLSARDDTVNPEEMDWCVRPLSFSADAWESTHDWQSWRLCNATWFAVVGFLTTSLPFFKGLVRERSSSNLKPFGEFRNDDHELFNQTPLPSPAATASSTKS